MNPLISIITPVYNAEKFIHLTVNSILSQTYKNWELWLINDCSQDNSSQIIDQFSEEDSRINVIHFEVNKGAAEARNEGLRRARGNFIAFIDSDDVWHPEKLEKQLQFMQVNQYEFTYTNIALVDEDGQILKESVEIPSSLNYHQLLKNTAIACSTVMINIERIGKFSMPLVRKGQDTATWLKLMREHHLTAYGLNEVLNYYRQVANSISSNKWGALKRTWNTYYHLEKLPLPKALYYFTLYVYNAIRRRI